MENHEYILYSELVFAIKVLLFQNLHVRLLLYTLIIVDII